MPQSEDLDEFWDNLKNSKDMITVIPPDRWRWEDYYGDPLKEVNKSNSKWGGFMKEIDKFDPLFFGISPREAQMMDPQQRIFLEHVWKAIEDSGQKVSDLSGTKTGVFVGVATNDYIDVMNSGNVVLDGYSRLGKLALGPGQPGVLPAQLARTQRADRHRLFQLAGRPAPGHRIDPHRKLRHGHRRRRAGHAHARPHTSRSAWPAC